MYNYEFDASERHLWMDMGTELVPLIEKPPELIGCMAKYVSFLQLYVSYFLKAYGVKLVFH